MYVKNLNQLPEDYLKNKKFFKSQTPDDTASAYFRSIAYNQSRSRK